MNWQRKEYKEVRPLMQAGDIIAFGGDGDFSKIIKWSTRSAVSHIGIILQSQLLINGDPQTGMFNNVIESTLINGFMGVSISTLSKRVHDYPGEVWWLPLSDTARNKLNESVFYNFLLHQEGKKYDYPQALGSVLDALDNVPGIGRLTHNSEDFSKFFCSELVAAGLEKGGVINRINASEVTPIDLCKFNLYGHSYAQIKGTDKKINGINTLDPEGWGH